MWEGRRYTALQNYWQPPSLATNNSRKLIRLFWEISVNTRRNRQTQERLNPAFNHCCRLQEHVKSFVLRDGRTKLLSGGQQLLLMEPELFWWPQLPGCLRSVYLH